MYKRIILAYDGSSSGQQALLSIKDLAHWERPKLTLVAVAPPLEMDLGAVEMGYLGSTSNVAIEDKLKEQLRKGVKALRSMGFEADGEILKGEVIKEITSYASNQRADLIVVGHKHESSLLRRWWSGSTAKSLVEEAPCNVLIVVYK
ncbi:universal stress protein [Limnohabitans sp.]|uniref:universal stress protein n=1 Tax=Limnohabitans sp. TaxID=1907725 RepID=UPI0035AE848E